MGGFRVSLARGEIIGIHGVRMECISLVFSALLPLAFDCSLLWNVIQ